VYDQGNEFLGQAFQQTLANAGVKGVPVNKRTPTANAVCERIHQAVAQVLRILMHTQPPSDINELSDVIDSALATAMHASRCAISSSLSNASPGSLAFHRDMFFNLPLMANIIALRGKRQLKIDQELVRENSKRISCDYKIGDKVWVSVWNKTKMSDQWSGPYPIKRVHVNGNVTIQRPHGVSERLNIRKIKPDFSSRNE